MHTENHKTMIWTKDNQGYFYTQFRKLKILYKYNFRIIYQHELFYRQFFNDKNFEDIFIYEFPKNQQITSLKITNCGEYLIITVKSYEYEGHNIYFIHFQNKNEKMKKNDDKWLNSTRKRKFHVIHLIKQWNAEYQYVMNIKSKMIFLTNKNAPNKQLIVIDFKNLSYKWKILLHQHHLYILKYVIVMNRNLLILKYINDNKIINKLLYLKITSKLKRKSSSFSNLMKTRLKLYRKIMKILKLYPELSKKNFYRKYYKFHFYAGYENYKNHMTNTLAYYGLKIQSLEFSKYDYHFRSYCEKSFVTY